MRKKFRDIVLDSVNVHHLKILSGKLNIIDVRISKRVNFLILLIEKPNLTYVKIAEKLEVNRKSLNRWSHKFKHMGLEGLIGKDYYSIETLTESACNYIGNWVDNGSFINFSSNYLASCIELVGYGNYSNKIISKILNKTIRNKCKIFRISESELKRRIEEKNKQNKQNEKNEKESIKRNIESIKYLAQKIIDGKKIR